MTSTIKVDNIQNQCGGAVVTKCGGTTTISGSVVKANNIQASDGGNLVSQSGTTITLGASGDTIALASGATQTGFGRTGTVDWQTTPKTATFTAVSGEGYFANTSGGAFNMNLPAGSAGAIVSVADYAATWQTNALTVVPNGTDKIGGQNENATLSTEGQSVTLVYVDSTQGWINTMDSTSNVRGNPLFICASVSGACNTLTNDGDYKVAKFVGPGTFTVNAVAGVCGPTRNNVSYLVVGGGASGGSTQIGGGGGGAGGFREYRAPLSGCYSVSPLNGNPGGTSITVTAQAYPITVGAGGASGPAPGNPTVKGNPGSVSTFDTVTSAGGGGGAADNCVSKHADPGGSGGGGYGASGTNAGGTGNTPSVSPAQGTNGGPAGGNPSNYANSGGGGGAICAGEPITGNFPGGGPGGNGGNGATTSITGSPTSYAGGGGGSADNRAASRTGGDGGTGGGGQGGDPTRGPTAGTVNTGGGGGGQHGPCSPSNTGPAGAGGSGIVVIRYKYQ